MAISFDTGGEGFAAFVRYNAKEGTLTLKRDGVETIVDKPSFVIDFDNMKHGYLNFVKGSAPAIKNVVDMNTQGVQPQEKDEKGNYLFKHGLLFEATSPKFFGGLVEFKNNSIAFCKAVMEQYEVYLKEKNNNVGKLPVVMVGGTVPSDKHGNKKPIFVITGWVEKPAEFGKTNVVSLNTATLSPVAAAAPGKASNSEF